MTDYLTEKEQLYLAVKIVKVLNGVSILEAQHILKDAASLVMDSQLVDIKSRRFRSKLEELGISAP